MNALACVIIIAALIRHSDCCVATSPTTNPVVTPCLNCAANLITVTQAGIAAKPMDGDVIVRTGACAVRTFTCTGANNPNINFNNGGGTIVDGDDGVVDLSTTFAVTCNAAGTAWESNGVPITQVECADPVTPCLTCAANLITITQAGNGAKPMDGDVTDATGACSTRTFTCTGVNRNHHIDINNGGGVIMDGDDGVVDMSVTFVVTCNAAGTAWESGGVPITQLECADPVNPCLACAANLITITTVGAGLKPMDGDVTNTMGACATRTFTCLGTSPNIDFNNGAGTITDGADGAVDGSAMLVLTCNAAGTAWESNGVAITQIQCKEPCLTCAANLITVTAVGAGLKPMDGDVTNTMGACATRTFTCLGTSPNIEFNNAAGLITDGADGAVDGSAMLVLTCNSAGTAWESNGIAITQVQCKQPCLTCAANLITVTTAGVGIKPMDGDVTNTMGACATRTFTCLGTTPDIDFNNGAGTITDGADGAVDGSAMLVLTCNAAGTVWESNGVAITQVQCKIPCKTCAANLITVTTAGLGIKPMDGDVTNTAGACATRAFTCLGATNPNIDYNNGAGMITDGADGAVDGSATFALTCNAAGTAWESNGVAVTQVQCKTPCLTCAANLITVTTAGVGIKPMDGDVTDTMGACATRTFTCLGTSPNIDFNNGAGMIVDGADGAVDGSATFAVTCNAAGTAWEVNGMPITQVQCAIPCLTCAANLITITQAGVGAKPFDGDVTNTMGACATRTFTCLGANNPNIEINNGFGTIVDGDDGAVDGSASFEVTCNAAGTAWEVGGVAVTQVECQVPPLCLTCAANLITITTAGLGIKPMDGDVTNTAGACATRTFTCMGATNPTIGYNNGAGAQADGADGAVDGSATLVLTCNAAGTAWESNGVAVTQAQCETPCLTCAANLITVTQAGPQAKPFDGDATNTAGACATRKFTCMGANNPNIDVNNGFGVIFDGDDGVVDGAATLEVTCNAAGTGWEFAGIPITQVECSSG